MKKVAYAIIVIFLLSLFGYGVKHVYTGGQLGVFTKPLKEFTGWFDLLKPAVEEATTPSRQYMKTPDDFSAVNKLDYDLFALYTRPSGTLTRNIDLINLRNDSLVYTWKVDRNFDDRNVRLFHPILNGDKSIFVQIVGGDFLKLDAEGNTIWAAGDTLLAHHTMELDHEGNIWTCGKYKNAWGHKQYTRIIWFPHGGRKVYFGDVIVKRDAETGEVLFLKSMTDIFLENDLFHEILKANFDSGPFHLNDIEPVLEDGENMKKGDVFLSNRNTSSIIHYRPSTNEVLRYIEGPFAFQHDVDVINDSILTLFNNNTLSVLSTKEEYERAGGLKSSFHSYNSQILFYNYNTGEFTTHIDEQLKRDPMFSYHEGLHHWLPNNHLFIEEQMPSVLWVYNDTNLVYKDVLASDREGYHYMTNWLRIVDNELVYDTFGH